MEMRAESALANPVAPYPFATRFRSASLFRTDVGVLCVPLAFFPTRLGPNGFWLYVVTLTFVVPLPLTALLTSRFAVGDGAVVPMPTPTLDA